ncbi:MAG: hypothetical protein ABEJ98_03165 [Candidatus Nanohaloarchaea archaeon]
MTLERPIDWGWDHPADEYEEVLERVAREEAQQLEENYNISPEYRGPVIASDESFDQFVDPMGGAVCTEIPGPEGSFTGIAFRDGVQEWIEPEEGTIDPSKRSDIRHELAHAIHESYNEEARKSTIKAEGSKDIVLAANEAFAINEDNRVEGDDSSMTLYDDFWQLPNRWDNLTSDPHTYGGFAAYVVREMYEDKGLSEEKAAQKTGEQLLETGNFEELEELVGYSFNQLGLPYFGDELETCTESVKSERQQSVKQHLSRVRDTVDTEEPGNISLYLNGRAYTDAVEREFDEDLQELQATVDKLEEYRETAN